MLMFSKNVPYIAQAGLLLSLGADSHAKKLINDALAEMTDGICEFAQGYIYLCSIVLFGGELDDDDPCNMCDDVGDTIVEIMEQKLARWKYRLMKKEEVDVPEE